MNRNLICRVLILIGIVALSSCHDKNALIIKGKIINPGRIKTILLMKTDSNQVLGMTLVDSVALSDGRFSFKLVSPNPEYYKVLAGGFPMDVIGKNGEEIDLEMDTNDTTLNYKVSGSEESTQMKLYSQACLNYSNLTYDINNHYKAAIKKAHNKLDSGKVNGIYTIRFDSAENAYSNWVLKYMKDNQTSISAFYAALSLDRYKYEQQLVAYADSINGKFNQNFAIRDFVKQMMLIKPLTVGHKAPDFALTDADNKPVKLSDYKGKYLLIDFWASWCGPCRQENPNVVKAYAAYKDKGLNILGISLDDNRSDWQTAIAQDKLTWRHAAEFKRFDGPTVLKYKIEAIPSNFFIDPKGVIIAKNVTGPALEALLNKTFSKPQ